MTFAACWRNATGKFKSHVLLPLNFLPPSRGSKMSDHEVCLLGQKEDEEAFFVPMSCALDSDGHKNVLPLIGYSYSLENGQKESKVSAETKKQNK